MTDRRMLARLTTGRSASWGNEVIRSTALFTS